MIQCQNLDKNDLQQIGYYIGQAFIAEKGCFSILDADIATRMFTMIIGLPWKTVHLLQKAQNNWEPTERRYKNNDDFVEVFLIAVRKEYQKQGYFRKMLEEPFELAQKRNTICVLDTDSIVKAEKYCHVGMRIIDRKIQKNGIEMFALEK